MIYQLIIFLDPESGHELTGQSVQGLIKLKSGCKLEYSLMWSSGSSSKHIIVDGRVQFFAIVGLRS